MNIQRFINESLTFLFRMFLSSWAELHTPLRYSDVICACTVKWSKLRPSGSPCQPRHLTTEVNWPLRSVRVRSARDLKSLPYDESIQNMLLSAAPAMPRSFLLSFFLPTWDFMSRHSPFYSPFAQFDILGSTFKWHWMAFGMLFLAYFLSKQTSTLYFRPHCSEENLLLSELKAVIEKRNGKKFKSWFI